MPWFAWPGLLLTSYFIGGIPTAYVATRLLKGQDIRRLGDHNAGLRSNQRWIRTFMVIGVIFIPAWLIEIGPPLLKILAAT